MDLCKATLFFIFLITWTILYGVVGLFVVLTFNPNLTSKIAYPWAKVIGWYLKYCCNVKIKIEGLQHLPKTPFIIASNHQSAWETIYFMELFINPVFVLKRSLKLIPIYGWYLHIMGMIAIDRNKPSSIRIIEKQAKEVFIQNRILIIFPQGTRASTNTDKYKSGIYALHRAYPQIPIVPVYVNSGLIWPKGSFNVKEGCINLKISKPLIGNYTKEELLIALQNNN